MKSKNVVAEAMVGDVLEVEEEEKEKMVRRGRW